MKRDLAIDATRGLAIWSMVSLHFANGMLIAVPTHAYPLVDGMSAFVLLSGLVLGLVYHRWIDASSLRYAYGRLARRLVALYLAQLFISLTAVAVCTRLTAQQFRMIAVLPPDESVLQQVWWAVTMRFLPSGGSILVVYLILMALAFVVLPLLQHGAWPWVLAGSGTLYVWSQVAPAPWMVVDSHPGGGPIQNWLAWQVLFVPAMVVGWNWSRWQVAERIDAALPVLAAVCVIAGATLAHGLWIAGWLRPMTDLIGKVGLGPLRALAAWLVVATVYGVFRRLLQWMRHDWFRPLVMAGSRSLDSYVIQAVALLAVSTWIVFRPWGAGLSTVIVVAVFAACWGWAEFRHRMEIDKLHRLPVIAARAARRRAGAGAPASV
ncbi:OpgC domain-containing protein [Gordonia iterans]